MGRPTLIGPMPLAAVIFVPPEGRLTRRMARQIVSRWMVYCRFHGPRQRCALPAKVRRAYRLFTKFDRTKPSAADMAARARLTARARAANGSYVSNFDKVKGLQMPPGGRLLTRSLRPAIRKPSSFRHMVELEVPGPLPGYVYRYRSGNAPWGYFRMTHPGKGRWRRVPGIAPFPWKPIPRSIFERLHPLVRAFLRALTPPRMKHRRKAGIRS
jgi:hypothetical protein